MSFWQVSWFPSLYWLQPMEFNSKNHERIKELYYVFPATIVIFIFRYFLKKFIFQPMGCYFGLRHRTINTEENWVLEKTFTSCVRNIKEKIYGLPKQFDSSERKIQKWIRQRARCDKMDTLMKFTESGWRLTFKSGVVFYGFYILSAKPCLLDTTKCFKEHYQQEFTDEFWWHCIVELGYYFSQIFIEFRDAKKKGIWITVAHHITTISLLIFGFVLNICPFASLILLIHDVSDVPLEIGIMSKYFKKHRLANVILVLFCIVWIVTRLMIYPYRIIYHLLAGTINPIFSGYYIATPLLSLLQVLNFFWASMILQFAINVLTLKSENVKDLRSDSEESDFSCERKVSPGETYGFY